MRKRMEYYYSRNYRRRTRRCKCRSYFYCHSSEVPEDAVVPSAPPLDLMDQLTGYEMTSYDSSVCVPPPDTAEESPEGGGTTRAPIATVPPLTEAQARAQLLSFVAEKCCWGRGAAKDMAITKIVTTSAYHYELQSFTEKRETSWAFTPYGGGEVDGPMYGTPPKPWEISATPTELFRNEIKILPVPHTASVKPCHRCKGTGSLLCQECHGKGWTRCLSCHGDGWHTDTSGNRERCYFCNSSSHGRGRQDCLKCNAKGRVACPPCDSYGQIRCFISLTVTWKTYTSEHIVEKTSGLPEGLIREVSGQVVLEEEGSRVIPLKNFPESTITLASSQLVMNHSQQWPDEKQLAQRHQVRLVPIYEIHYTWKRYQGKFHLYGYENKVYAPEYPQTCCWGCTIM
ncbi:protein SSUH2 homolog isoform X2 [Artemia franciscana]|uniref:protein SSUH2 homolog isoform X2 n=1 Tax=Artemia franciscana TaxID=6661 RepID=UPI0032DBC78C